MSAPTILVVGASETALEAARGVVAQGGRAVLVQRRPRKACALRVPSGIEVITAELVRLDGRPGAFTAHLIADGESLAVHAEAVILAEGREETPADGAWPEGIASAAVVLGPHASRGDHLRAFDIALQLRSRSPAPEVTIFVKDVQASGRDEIVYANAQRAGARVVRSERPPTIENSPQAKLMAVDAPSGLDVVVLPDILIAVGLEPPSVGRVAEVIGNVSMGPVSSMREGVLFCRPAERDLCGGDLVTEARAAAVRAVTIATSTVDRSATSARVDRDRCSACLTCVRSCPFHAPRIDDEGKAAVDVDLCQACGVCVAACPSNAISLPLDADWRAKLLSMFEVSP